MRTIGLGGTAITTSRLGFGCASLHHLTRRRLRQSLLASAFDHGISHFDTAPYYGHELAERELGFFAKSRRNKLVIATKFGIEPNALFSRAPALMYGQLAVNAALRKITRLEKISVTPRNDYSPDNARLSLERSLRTLATDHVDIFFIHQPTLLMFPDADRLAATLQQIKQAGKARYIGLSGRAADCIEIARRYPGLAEIMQIDAAPGSGELAQMAATNLTCHISFGHLRNRRLPLSDLLQEAIRQNPNGVILFSTRKYARVAAMTSALAGLETQ
jgi:aryl-alcohol dehydrogenase-like predicted oxidoreductase